MNRHASAVAFACLSACAPSTYDGLVGGPGPGASPIVPRESNIVVDPLLLPPRPVSPISVSSVASRRPRFSWKAAPSSIGAILELSRTRDFTGERRRYVVTGTELALTEDLEPGFWFWRLKARAEASEGSDLNASPVWELLVRGPAKGFDGADHASTAPSGGIVDMNGDGEPDLVLGVEELGELDTSPHQAYHYLLFGQKDHTFAVAADDDPQHALIRPMDDPEADITGGVDLDGDGYPDLVLSNAWVTDGGPVAEAFVDYGGGAGIDNDKSGFEAGMLPGPMTSVAARVRMVGDVDGDGFGDVGIAGPGFVFAALGASDGPSTILPITYTSLAAPLAVFATPVDFDGDGRSDLALSVPQTSSPISWTRGAPNRLDRLAPIPRSTTAVLGAATALAGGDFDGDGVAEVAFSTSIDGKSAVCSFIAGVGALGADRCWTADAAIPGFASSLVAGDLDGDGRDELIVSSDSGLFVLTRTPTGFTSEAIAGDLRRVTMIYPGRPGAARWAALSASGKFISLFEARAVKQVLDVSASEIIVKVHSIH